MHLYTIARTLLTILSKKQYIITLKLLKKG